MKILVVSQGYWPEAFRINELCGSLTRSGSSVVVLTGQPNYPDGRVFPGYSALSVGRETHPDGYLIYRVPVSPRGNATALRLIANYCSFIISACFFGPWLLRGARFDVIFVYATSPVLQAIPAIFLRAFKKAPLIVWVQDLWPESLKTTGYVSNPFLLRLVQYAVSFIYRSADLILAQSRSFIESIKEFAGSTPVEYFPNPGEGAFNEPVSVDKPVEQWTKSFNVVFAGNLGTVQALHTIVDAAELLQDDHEIRLTLIGSGSRAAWLNSEVGRRGLSNVQLPGRFAAHEMPQLLSQASALLVSLIRSPGLSRTIPSKVQAYLAAGRPIIAALDGEGAEVVRQAGAGISVPAEDAPALASAIRQMKALSASERAVMGESGRRYYREHFDPRILADLLVRRITDLPSVTNANRLESVSG